MKASWLVAGVSLVVVFAACEETDHREAASRGTPELSRTLSLAGISFDVECANHGSLNELRVTPAGLEIVNDPVRVQVDGVAHHAEVADLNHDGSPELYVFVTSAGSGSYGSIVAWSANNRKSLSRIYLPELDPDSPEGRGYMGHDEFAIEGSRLVRRFPIYLPGDPNAAPTGGTRRLVYELTAGEAGWILELEKTSRP